MTEPHEHLSLKVLSINTHKGFSALNRKFVLPELREAVRSVSADIVFLQEVIGAHTRHAQRHENWPPTPQYEFLADSMWPEFAYGRNAVYPDGDHGNALLSKFPIIHYQNLDVTVRSREKRGLLHCILKAPHWTTEVHAICVHLGLLESHRQQQLELLCDFISGLPETAPLIIAGDFNDWRVKANRQLLQCASVNEVFVATGGTPARTFPARWPLLPLDRIYWRNVKLHCAQVLSTRPWTHLSDHTPIAADMQL